MKNCHGVWLPDDEEHLLKWADKPGWTYQVNKFLKCAPLFRGRDIAVDVGAHCGLWSMMMRDVFKTIHAFEPLERHIECFKLNVPTAVLHECALGEKVQQVGMNVVPTVSGRSHIHGKGTIPVDKLDSFDIAPDFLKIDCEGYEYFVLRGGENTIKKYKPVIIVEQKSNLAQRYGIKPTKAVNWLVKQGYQVRDILYGDYILS